MVRGVADLAVLVRGDGGGWGEGISVRVEGAYFGLRCRRLWGLWGFARFAWFLFICPDTELRVIQKPLIT